MSLISQFSREFDSGVRLRGADYFRAGRVRIDPASASRITAAVRGTSTYKVELERREDRIRASCTCPYFDTGLCKHIWAVVLAAGNLPLLAEGGLNGRPRLVRESEEVEEVEEVEERSDAPAQTSRYPRPSPLLSVRPPLRPQLRASTPRSVSPSNWRMQIARLTAEPLALPSPRAAWPPKRELLYVVDVENTQTDGGLSLQLFCRDLKKDGTRAKAKLKPLRREWLTHLPEAADRRILAFLAGAKEFYGGYGYYGAGD